MDGGGAQRSMLNLVREFRGKGIDATLVVAKRGGKAEDWLSADVPVLDLKAQRTRNALPSLVRTLRTHAFDLHFSTMIDANILSGIATRFLSKKPKIIFRETNSQRARGDLGLFRRSLISLTYPMADRVIALSEGVRDELIEDLNLTAEQTVTIHNPVRLNVPQTAQEAGRPFSGKYIVGAGRLTRQKNFHALVSTLPHLPEDVHVVILGDGEDRESLLSLASTLGVGSRLHLPGFVSNPSFWFSNSELFVLSSRWEGFGHVIVEAMAAGTPVVSTDCPHGPRDIIDSGVNGTLVPNEDPQALAAAINQLLLSPELRKEFARKGRVAAERFSSERIAQQYVDLFDQLRAR